MAWWRFWEKRPRARNLLVFELISAGAIDVRADWADSETTPDRDDLAKGMAALAFLVTNGRMDHKVQQAIAVAGYLKGDNQVAEQALANLASLGPHRAGQGSPDDDDGDAIVVKPDEIFSKG